MNLIITKNKSINQMVFIYIKNILEELSVPTSIYENHKIDRFDKNKERIR